MKYLFVILFLIIASATINAQSVPKENSSVDTVVKQSPERVLSDTTLLFSTADMKSFFEALGEKIKLPNGTSFQITGNERDKIAFVFQQIIHARAVQRWKDLNTKK